MMAISLYTSRIVLLALGVTDYGIYNAVGGVVSLFSFISASMQSATQRFLTCELAKNNDKGFNSVFSSSIFLYLIIGFVFLLLAETIGLWFVRQKMDIATSDIARVEYIYQLSVATTIFLFFRIPYMAGVLSQEKMSFFAFNSIFEAGLKLLLIFVLLNVNEDKLVLYAWLILFATILINVVYVLWSRIFYSRLYRLSLNFSKSTLIDIASFSGWRMLGAFSEVTSRQGTNILLNVIWGPIVNAALGIAYQVNQAIYTLLNGFQQAFVPILTKLYAEKTQNEKISQFIKSTSLISFALISIICLPLIINIDTVLSLWLTEVPSYTAMFSILLIANILVDAYSAPLYTIILATGKIACYQIWLSCITIMGFLLSIVFAYILKTPEFVLIPKILSTLVLLIYRWKLVGKIIHFNSMTYVKDTLLKPIFLFVFTCISLGLLSNVLSGISMLLCSFVLTLTIYPLLFYVLILGRGEKELIQNFFKSKLHFNEK